MALAYALLFVVPLNGEGPVEPALRWNLLPPSRAVRNYHA